MKIIFNGVVPSKKNSKTMVCRGRVPMLIPSKSYIEWHKEQSELLKGLEPIGRDKLCFEYFFYIPTNKDGSFSGRPFDYSNKIESINDLLTDLGIIEDDNYYIISEIHIYSKFVEYGEGKIELIIT